MIRSQFVPHFVRRSVLACAVLFSSTLAMADTFKLDPAHTSIVFKVQHANASNFYGRFNKAAGEVAVDAGALTSLNISVPTDSIDTNSTKRDDHLKGPDFFNAKEFPEITFKSTAVKKIDDTNFEVTGDLGLHGVTKPVTIKVVKTGAGEMMGKQIVGFETTVTIKRSDYGMNGYIGKGVGDEVTLIVAFEANK